MPRAHRPRDYFEPWVCAKNRAWESGYRFGPPACDNLEVIERWQAARDRAEANADWLVLGERMAAPTIVTSLEGVVSVMADRRPLFSVARTLGLDDHAPDQEALAGRVCACVNAMAGIADPEAMVASVRQLLLDMVQGATDSRDDRVLAALAHMIPPSELREFLECTSNRQES